MDDLRARHSPRGLALALALALAAGCAGSHPRPAADVTAGPRPRAALLPLENLTLREDASETMTRVLFVELVKRGLFQMAEAGEVEAAMESLRLRPMGSLASLVRLDLARRLSVAYFMVGTVLEYDVAHTPEGDVPAVSMALKLIDAADGRVLWAEMKVRTGDDKERIFGWGRESSRDRLASELAAEMLESLALPAAAPPPAPPAAAPPDSARAETPR